MVSKHAFESRREWVKISELEFPETTQREHISWSWIRSHTQVFDPEKLNLLTVNVRDGHKYVIDGMHRTLLLREVGWDDQTIEANVYHDLTEQQEADLFIGLDDRRKVAKTDLFRVRVTRGDEDAVRLNQIVQGLGLRVGASSSTSARTVTAVKTLEQVYDGAGIVNRRCPSEVRDTLKALKDAFGESPQTWKATHLIGVGRFLIRNRNGDAKDGRIVSELVRKLQAYPGGAPAVEAKIRGRRTIMGGGSAENAEATYYDIYRKRPGSK